MSTAIMQSDIVHERVMRIIDEIKAVDIDGETMEYIIRAVGMQEQMLRQLIMSGDLATINDLVLEKRLNG